MDIPQIAGRIRTKENPFRNKLVHIFNTRSIDTYDTYKQMERDLERQLQYAKERVQIYAHLSKGAKEQQRKEIEKSASYIKPSNTSLASRLFIKNSNPPMIIHIFI